jgi:hypothetical protein
MEASRLPSSQIKAIQIGQSFPIPECRGPETYPYDISERGGDDKPAEKGGLKNG